MAADLGPLGAPRAEGPPQPQWVTCGNVAEDVTELVSSVRRSQAAVAACGSAASVKESLDGNSLSSKIHPDNKPVHTRVQPASSPPGPPWQEKPI